MKISNYNFYKKLQKGPVNVVVNSTTKSDTFQMLINAKIIEKVKSGRGANWIVINEDKFSQFIANTFPDEEADISTKAGAQRKFRNTKAGKKDVILSSSYVASSQYF
jgi:hypothetical protein